jgi:hypothetical protein
MVAWLTPLAASSNEANLWMTLSGLSTEAIELEEKLIKHTTLVEIGVREANPGQGEVSQGLTHLGYGCSSVVHHRRSSQNG